MTPIKNSKFPNTGFHHVSLKVKDYDKSCRLYTDALGMNIALSWGDSPERACMMDIGDGTYIELFEGGTANVALQPEPIIHFALLTDACDAMYDAAIAAGCTSHMAPDDVTIHGHAGDQPIRISFVVGYDGELVEFFQYK